LYDRVELSPGGALRARATPIASAGEDLAQLAASENFPVASRLLPRRQRTHLLAIYGFCRLADDIGDESSGDRLAELDWLEAELDRAFADSASHPVLVRLQPTIDACGLSRQPFADLIQANRQDQTVTRYETWPDLLRYCALSAQPVGRLVLRVFDVDTPERVAWSDDVCSALQVVEHLQDIGEDARRGRIYLPADDLARAGCAERDLLTATAGRALRSVVAGIGDRARRLLDAGVPLARSLRGRPRWAVAGFAAGGSAALDAIERAGFDVLASSPRPSRVGVLRHALSITAGRQRGAG
jgi:squalene synthase HpnC